MRYSGVFHCPNHLSLLSLIWPWWPGGVLLQYHGTRPESAVGGASLPFLGIIAVSVMRQGKTRPKQRSSKKDRNGEQSRIQYSNKYGRFRQEMKWAESVGPDPRSSGSTGRVMWWTQSGVTGTHRNRPPRQRPAADSGASAAAAAHARQKPALYSIIPLYAAARWHVPAFRDALNVPTSSSARPAFI